jgi:hypothetical protein
MRIRNEQQYPVFHRYAGKGRAGRNLKPGQVSPEVPNDRILLSVVQRHVTNGLITIYVTKAEKEALKGNVPDGVYNSLKTSTPECSVANAPKKAAAPKAQTPPPAPKAQTPPPAPKGDGDPQVKKPGRANTPPAPPEEPEEVVEEKEVVTEPEAPAEPETGKAPDPAEQPKSKHLNEKASEVKEPATAEDLTEDPVKKHAKKTTTKKSADKKTSAKKSTAKKPETKKAPAPKEEAAVKDYKDLNKAELLKEFESRGLKKPAATTSTTRLRQRLVKDDESK